jgi:uncharacterized membrane protein
MSESPLAVPKAELAHDHTLKHRFARGEIDRAEYEDRRKLFSDT